MCTPDKDMAQLVVDERVVLLDRRRRITYDEPAVMVKWGVPPSSIPDWLALVGDSSDGYPGLPGWGAKSAAAVLARYGSLEAIPAKASAWDVKSLRGAPVLAATLRERWDEVQLYRSLARLRTTEDGVDIPQQSVDELRWRGHATGRMEGVLRRRGACRSTRAAPTAGWTEGDAYFLTRRSSSGVVDAGARGCRSSGSCATGRTRALPARSVTVAPPRSAIRPAAATSHEREPALLDERVEPAVADVGERTAPPSPSSAGRGSALRTDPGAGDQRRPGERHRDDEIGQRLLVGGLDRLAVERRRPVVGRGERLAPDRVVDDPDDRAAGLDQRDRDAEERDAVGVVDRAVERVDDPGAADRRPSARARHRRARRSPRR